MTRLAVLLLLQAVPGAPPASPEPPNRTVAVPPPGARAPRPAAVRPVPDSALAAIRADPAFQYDRPVAEQPSLAERFWRWVGENLLGPLLRGSGSRAGQAFWLAVALLVLAAAGAYLFRHGVGGVFGRRDVPDDADDPLLGVADIATVDLAALLADALARGDWRAAVRLRYLVALQRLDARGLVRWSRDKTDRAFVREATAAGGADVGRAVADVVRAFQLVWYGGLSVDAARWSRVDARFARLDAAVDALPRGAARTSRAQSPA